MNEENEKLDISEKGRAPDGSVVSSNRRLIMQLQVFTDCSNIDALATELKNAGFPSVLYKDFSDPQGVGLLTYSEDAAFFSTQLRDFINGSSFAKLTRRPDFTMTGRSYTIGYEQDIENVLVDRPIRRAQDPALEWVVWYPLRRKPEFYRLPKKEQMPILKEHGDIGYKFGDAELGTDIRLASFGIDTNDNDFLIGLLGKELLPLSVLVQTMRSTIQTGKYMDSLGPFFVGHVFQQTA